MAEHNILGSQGEDYAAGFLQDQGYIILERNIRLYGIEVDIIAEKDDTLVFVEVKTRTNNLLPLDKLYSRRQRQRIVRAADFYVRKKQLDKDVRFDVIFIQRTKQGFSLEHIENAFYPQW